MATVDLPSVTITTNSITKEVNSDSEGKERRKVKPIVGRDAVVKTKPSIGKRLFESFFRDSLDNLPDDIFGDVIVPELKEAAFNMIRTILLDERDGSYRGGYRFTNYGSAYRGSSRSRKRRDRYDRRGSYDRDEPTDYRNIVLRRREDAENIVDELREFILDEGEVSVADLLEMVGEPSEFTDNDWGWRDERSIGIRKVNGGFLIDVGRARRLK